MRDRGALSAAPTLVAAALTADECAALFAPLLEFPKPLTLALAVWAGPTAWRWPYAPRAG